MRALSSPGGLFDGRLGGCFKAPRAVVRFGFDTGWSGENNIDYLKGFKEFLDGLRGLHVTPQEEIDQLRRSNTQMAIAAIESSDRLLRMTRLLRKAVALLLETTKGLPGVSDGHVKAFLDLPEIRELSQ